MSEETPTTPTPASPMSAGAAHAIVLAHTAKADLLKIIAGVSGLLSVAVDLLQLLPHGHRTFQLITVCSFGLAGLAHLSHTISTIRYTDAAAAVTGAYLSKGDKPQ